MPFLPSRIPYLFLLALIVVASASGCAPDETAQTPSADVDTTGTAITITDIVGRTVTLPGPAQRILLGEGRQLIALSLVHPRPADLIAGWLGDLSRLDPASYAQYTAAFPHIEDIPLVGITGEETFSVEKALAVEPDVAILGGRHGPSPSSSEIVQQLEAAGIPIVFIDFSTHPLENTVPSIAILGKVLGREEQAQAYIDFYQEHMQRIETRLAEADTTQPLVLMDMHAGAWECCSGPGNGNLGEFITFAGGHNIGADVIPGALGQMNLEYIIAQDPAVYVATGVPGRKDMGGLEIGAGVPAAEAQATLAAVAQRTGINDLSAIKNGRVHGLWHNFYVLPLNVLAAETLALWIHPELFADVDPNATLAEINERFLAVPFEGTFWINLD